MVRWAAEATREALRATQNARTPRRSDHGFTILAADPPAGLRERLAGPGRGLMQSTLFAIVEAAAGGMGYLNSFSVFVIVMVAVELQWYGPSELEECP